MSSEATLMAGWGDMDANGHMRNTAYLDKAVDVRMLFFGAHGFALSEFKRLGLGPVVMRDDIEYFREVHMLANIRGTLALAGMSDDGSRFILRNEFFHADGQRAARLTSTGGWLDLALRKLTAPPAALLAAMLALPRSDDFQSMKSSVK